MYSRISWPRLVLTSALCLLVVAAGIAYLSSAHPAATRSLPAAATRSLPAAATRSLPATATPSGPAAAATVTWAKLWAADFSGPAGSGVDRAQWVYQTGSGGFGNGSVETMTSSPRNIRLSGSGELEITALRQGATWTSGRIRSESAFTPPPGGELKVTASIAVPSPASALGYWPAFWLMGLGPWPEHGEIDIAEDVNGFSGHSAALHCGNLVRRNADGTLGPCHERTGLSSHLLPCRQCQADFHTYSVIVDLRHPGAGQVRWYLDGRKFFVVPEHEVGTATWNEAIDHGFAIMLDVAMGGSYPNQACHCVTPDSETSPGGTMRVRDVAVYQAVDPRR